MQPTQIDKAHRLRGLRALLALLALSTPAIAQIGGTIGQLPPPPVVPPANPTLQVPPFAFRTNRPICFVLIHGITSQASTDSRVGKLRYARNYWQPEFIAGLLGNVTDKPTTFSNDAELHQGNWETTNCSSLRSTDHILTIAGRPDPSQNYYPSCVMLTHRDGSRSLRDQSRDTAIQMMRIYQDVFGSWPAAKQPQLVLICHSGGGLVARTICTAPVALGGGTSDLLSRVVPVEGFTGADLNRMFFIRSRALYMITLSTPHEGAAVAKVADSVGRHLTFIPAIDKQDPDSLILQELTPTIMASYNSGPLDPSKCKRPDGSLIPIYCLGGRAPGGPSYYDDPNKNDNDLSTPDGGIRLRVDELEDQTAANRKEFQAYGLLKGDYATQLFHALRFGTHAYGACPADNLALDIIKIRDVHPVLGVLVPPSLNAVSLLAGPRLFYLRENWSTTKNKNGLFVRLGGTARDGFIDCDGFVPIDSSLGVKLGKSQKNHFDHTTGGSWYRYYRSALDFENHGSMTASHAVGAFLRTNITKCHPLNQAAGFVLSSAAGPKVSPGPLSQW